MMNSTYPCRVAGSLFNLLRSDDYGRKQFICRQFGISRSTLYRHTSTFTEMLAGPGRPEGTEDERTIEALRNELEEVRRRAERMENEAKHKHDLSIRRVTFLLISVGLSGRVIAWILRSAFDVRSNHTDILKLAQTYAQRATEIQSSPG